MAKGEQCSLKVFIDLKIDEATTNEFVFRLTTWALERKAVGCIYCEKLKISDYFYKVMCVLLLDYV